MIDLHLIAAPSFRVDLRGDAFVIGASNHRLIDLLGRAPFAPGEALNHLLDDESLGPCLDRFSACLRAVVPAAPDPIVRFRSSRTWWRLSVLPILGLDSDRVVALIGVATPASPRRPAERDERESMARMALAMEVLEGGFWHYDIANGVLDASPRLIELMTGTALDGVTWSAFVAAVHPDDVDLADISPLVRGLIETGAIEYRVRTAGGDLRWVRCKRKLIRDEAGRPDTVIGVVVDITEDKRIRTQIEHRATTDVLTKLCNRRGFEECAELYVARAAATGAGFGLVLIDLDRFKPINDAYGHAIGDGVLRTVARRIAREIRPTDIAARIGGDEFAVLVADIDDPIARLGERIVRALAGPIETPAGSVTLGASIGMAFGRGATLSIDELFERADLALYEVKRNGRGAAKLAA